MEIIDSVSTAGSHYSSFDGGGLIDFFLRYGLNILVVFVLVRILYYSRHKNKDFVFTFFLFNTVIFLICFLLSSTKIKIGFAFGLFAIFSILRYRTVSVPIREMGYFFVAVTIGIINALATYNLVGISQGIGTSDVTSQLAPIVNDVGVLLLSNGLILLMTYILDRQLSLDHENWKSITYERIDLIHPDKRKEMLEDLSQRTGLPIHRVEIMKINFMRDIASIRAFYFSKENESSSQGASPDDD